MITAQFKYSSTWERIQGLNTTKPGESYFFSTLNCIKDILLKEKRHKLQAVCICVYIQYLIDLSLLLLYAFVSVAKKSGNENELNQLLYGTN
jgi:hypothetical protein